MYIVYCIYKPVFARQKMNGLSQVPGQSFFRLNMDTVPNPEDTRAGTSTMIIGGSRRRMKKYKLNHKYKKGSGRSKGRTSRRTVNYVNYAGRQIGHLSQRQRQRLRQQQQQGNGGTKYNKYKRTLRARGRRHHQSGGGMILPADADLFVSSLGQLVKSGVSTLKGTEGPVSTLPFSDKFYERNL